MRKVMKLALESRQIRIKQLYDRFDGYEIHLYGDSRDDFDLADHLDKPIITVHYPIERCDIYDVCSEFGSEYARKVFDLCVRHQAGLVVHAETGLQRLQSHPDLQDFCRCLRELGVILHVENCYRFVGAIESLDVAYYLRELIGQDRVYPLLDTCHLMMSEMSFRFEEMSFFKTIEAYASENFKIHLNDCIGSGEWETGGTHGTNFYANQYLLRNILWMVHELEKKGLSIDLILEVDEDDYAYPTNAHQLAGNVESYWQKMEEEDSLTIADRPTRKKAARRQGD
ncbi:MAG: TIM barrel protein [Erysipelotrichaceae bacterium]|nr:TIM barrel protein [Erysipelotrichaceae bacterium]